MGDLQTPGVSHIILRCALRSLSKWQHALLSKADTSWGQCVRQFSGDQMIDHNVILLLGACLHGGIC